MRSNQFLNILTCICLFSLLNALLSFVKNSSQLKETISLNKFGYAEATVQNVACMKSTTPQICQYTIHFLTENNEQIKTSFSSSVDQLKLLHNKLLITYELQNPLETYVGILPQQTIATKTVLNEPEKDSYNKMILFGSIIVFLISLCTLLYISHLNYIEDNYSIVYM